MEKENVSLKQRVRDLETQLGSRKREVVSMEKKVNTLFRDNHMLQKTTTQYEQDRRDLEREVRTVKCLVSVINLGILRKPGHC